MILRSQLKEDQYVRVQPKLDDEDFWYKPMSGRYFGINSIAKEPDEARSYGPCMGSLVCWGMNYCLQLFNGNMEPVPEREQERIRYIFENPGEFKDLFKLGRKIERQVREVERIIEDDLGCRGHNIWEYQKAEYLIEDINLDAFNNLDEEDIADLEDDLKESFNEFLALLDKLTELEDKYIRQWAQEKASA
ncbi:MAG: hypothetical protein JL50_08360 [Peptococcaceae bacterium BICA1-7]|nr:MAG: hypothetical protein JL50_08360 [Peptococcaceae bacterium BICA1-7]HBV97425.1 hypothetical protein [Desulfotomaculum sp.]